VNTIDFGILLLHHLRYVSISLLMIPNRFETLSISFQYSMVLFFEFFDLSGLIDVRLLFRSASCQILLELLNLLLVLQLTLLEY
jgi:hypothetical protein